MKKTILIVSLFFFQVLACEKNSSNGDTSGTHATVTFTNNELFPQRVIITGTGAADTLYPLPNRVLDIDVAARSSVTRTDIPEGARKMYSSINCSASQSLATCTSYVYRNVMYLKGNSYTEVLRP